MANIGPDLDTLYSELKAQKLPYVLDTLFRIKLQHYGTQHWGDKTPTYSRTFFIKLGLIWINRWKKV